MADVSLPTRAVETIFLILFANMMVARESKLLSLVH